MGKGSKAMFKKLDTLAGLPPIVPPGPNVFSSTEYARGIGLAGASARVRLQKLEAAGQVKKVRSKIAGAIRECWLYLGEKE